MSNVRNYNNHDKKGTYQYVQGLSEDKIPNTETNRFYAKVLLPNENGCMIWVGARNPLGYGTFSLQGGKTIKAHKVKAWSKI